MKKISFFLLLTLLAVLIAFPVSADDAKLTVEISGTEVVTTGTTVDYTFTVKNITLSDGILGADVHISYDPSVFEYSNASTTEPSGWSTGIVKDTSAGVVKFTSVENNADTANAVKTDGGLKYTVSLKVKSDAAKQSKIDFSLIQCVDSEFNSHTGTGTALSVSVKQTLPTPDGLTWDGSVAKWNAVENADSYSVQVYKDSKEYGAPVSVEGAVQYDFSKALTEGGKYYFTVTAISSKPEYEDSGESQMSSSFYSVVGKLAAPTIKLSSDIANGGLKYQITDTNASGTVSTYLVEIYEKGSDSPVKELMTDDKAGNIACDGSSIAVNKEYTATVTAITEDESLNKNSDRSSHTAASAAADKVQSIQIKTLPKLTYTEGDKLDLSALVITLNYASGGTKDVKYADFTENGLSANWDNGKVLSMSDSGKTVTIFFGTSISTTSTALTVESGDCKHGTTHSDHKDATCGEDGYDKVICDLCGITVSETVLSATGEHTYGEWTILYNPTATLNGVQERECSVCGHKETAEIPAVGDGTTTEDPNAATTPSDTSDSDETSKGDQTTEDTTEPDNQDVGGGMSDLSRIFLIIVIVVFSLILLFIVGGVWLENRRSKARRSRMNNRNRRR